MTPKALLKAARSGRAIVWLHGGHMPAAFLASMQFHRVMEALPKITLYPRRKK